MKYLKNIFFTIGIICLLFIPNKIFAATILTCDKETLSALESTTCNISIQGANETLTSFSGTVSLSGNLELVSAKDVWNGNTNNGQFNLTSTNGGSNIGTIVVKVKEGISNSSETIAIRNININGQSYTDVSTSINVPSFSNPNLNSLSIAGGTLSPTFNGNTTNYTANVNTSSVTISATAPNKGSVSGIGSKPLNYGKNTFKVVSTAENGTTKTYTITITRKDTEVRLKSLEPVNNFTMGTTLYNVTLPSTQDTYTLNAIPMSERSKVNILPSATIKLIPGERKTISVTVTSESGNTKTYTVNVFRKDDKNGDTTLKNLTLKDVDIKFKSNTSSYKATVENNIEEIEINAEASDKNAKIEGLGKHKLNVGSNTIRVVVTAQNGSEKTYTITVVRKDEKGNVENLSNNTKIKSIKINNEDINIKDNVFTYSLSVENNISIVDLTYELEDEKSSATVEGNNELIVGNNKFKIIVTAEDGTTKKYEIQIERKELNNTIENNKESILNAIKDSESDIIVITVKNNDVNRIIDKEILEELKSKNKTLIYQILNEYKGLSYSITVKGNDVTSTTDNLDYGLSFKSKNQNTINNLSNNSKSIYLNFNSQGKLPALSIFKIFVGDKFKDGDKLYLYYFNEETNKLELVKSNLEIKDSYVEFEMKHFSEYILVNSLINENNTTDSSDNSQKIIIIGIALFIIIGLMIFIVIKSKKNKLKEKNTDVIDNTNINKDIKNETKEVSLKDEIKVEKQETKEEMSTDNKGTENTEKEETEDIEIIDM